MTAGRSRGAAQIGSITAGGGMGVSHHRRRRQRQGTGQVSSAAGETEGSCTSTGTWHVQLYIEQHRVLRSVVVSPLHRHINKYSILLVNNVSDLSHCMMHRVGKPVSLHTIFSLVYQGAITTRQSCGRENTSNKWMAVTKRTQNQVNIMRYKEGKNDKYTYYCRKQWKNVKITTMKEWTHFLYQSNNIAISHPITL